MPADVVTLRLLVFGLFFFFGGITSLNDVIIPKLKSLFTLSYAEAMLIQSAFFAAYFLVSLPAAAVVKRLGYMRGAAIGLLTMTAGCLLFIPASSSGMFIPFLLALFVLAAGITTVQVVTNPLISMLGPAATAHSRLTFAQAFNSLGTAIFPYIGSILILGSLLSATSVPIGQAAGSLYRAHELRVVVQTYIGLAAVLLVLTAIVWLNRYRLPSAPWRGANLLRAFNLLCRPRFGSGALCIFLYVGAEVAIGSLIINYLMQASVLGSTAEDAGKHVPLYWGGAMVGRFAGAYILRVIAPGKVLAYAAGIVIGLLFISASSIGPVSAWALLAIGLFNSIMFPTIFSLSCEGVGSRAADGSGIICMAIVGGAVVSPITGRVADIEGLKIALVVPAMCYAVILIFGMSTRHRNEKVPIAVRDISLRKEKRDGVGSE
jgi:FHS family L-fucose permease-like MFS transporter